jgi:5-methylcytosine-specific restriction endonuclease McrA
MRTCENPKCAETFVPYASGEPQRFCGPKCRSASYMRKPMRDAAYRAAHREKIAVRTAERSAKRRAKCIAYLGGKCVQCGATEALDFDHKQPKTKSFSITARLMHRWSTLEGELTKCQLLCRACHVRKTESENPSAAEMLRAAPLGGSQGRPVAKSTRHGTLTGYSSRKCRCCQCKAANSAYQREYHERNRDTRSFAAIKRLFAQHCSYQSSRGLSPL